MNKEQLLKIQQVAFHSKLIADFDKQLIEQVTKYPDSTSTVIYIPPSKGYNMDYIRDYYISNEYKVEAVNQQSWKIIWN